MLSQRDSIVKCNIILFETVSALRYRLIGLYRIRFGFAPSHSTKRAYNAR